MAFRQSQSMKFIDVCHLSCRKSRNHSVKLFSNEYLSSNNEQRATFIHLNRSIRSNQKQRFIDSACLFSYHLFYYRVNVSSSIFFFSPEHGDVSQRNEPHNHSDHANWKQKKPNSKEFTRVFERFNDI